MQAMNASNEGRSPEDCVITMDNYLVFREEMEGAMAYMAEEYAENTERLRGLTESTEEKVKMRDGAEISMYVIKPKTLTSKSAPGYFYAHGGGGWALGAHHLEANMMITALNLDCVVFNIDYRLAPEHKCPGPQEDFVDCMDHVFADPALCREGAYLG